MRMPRVTPKSTYSFAVSTFSGGINQEPDPQCCDLGNSPEAYNVKTDNGALSRCGGFGRASKYNGMAGKMLQIPQLPISGRMFVHRERANDTLYIHGTDGEYKEKYNITEDKLEFQSISREQYAEPTFAVNYQTSASTNMIYGCPTLAMTQVTPSGTVSLDGCPKFYRAIMHAERLFGVGTNLYPNRIFFSAQYGPSVFTVSAELGGYIDVMLDYGNAVDIVSFEDCVYVFWQYGITRLRAYGYQSEFVLSNCYRCSAEIKRESVQVCGDRIIFAAMDGVYSFNGESVRKISAPVSGFFGNEPEGNMPSGCFRDYYYVAMHYDKYEGAGNNILLRYNIRNDKWDMFVGLCVKQMLNISMGGNEQMLFLGESDYVYAFNGQNTFNGRNISSKWVTPMSTLQRPNMIKTVRCVLIGAQGGGRMKITMSSERGSVSKYITISARRKVYRVPLRVSGQMLSLTLENDGGNDFTAVAPMVAFTAYDCR